MPVCEYLPVLRHRRALCMDGLDRLFTSYWPFLGLLSSYSDEILLFVYCAYSSGIVLLIKTHITEKAWTFTFLRKYSNVNPWAVTFTIRTVSSICRFVIFCIKLSSLLTDAKSMSPRHHCRWYAPTVLRSHVMPRTVYISRDTFDIANFLSLKYSLPASNDSDEPYVDAAQSTCKTVEPAPSFYMLLRWLLADRDTTTTCELHEAYGLVSLTRLPRLEHNKDNNKAEFYY